MLTLDAALRFAEIVSRSAMTWCERLSTIEEKTISRLFEEVPTERMSQITREFSIALVLENRQRILRSINL